MPRSFPQRPCRKPQTAAILLLGLMVSGCGLGGPAYGPPSGQAAAVVELTNGLAFEPQSLHIVAGQSVEWRNRSFFTHSVTDDPSKAADPDDSSLPPGAESFDRTLKPGEVFRHGFPVPGTYRYFCAPHEDHDMLGEIVVEPAS
jgi:plastocyanin